MKIRLLICWLFTFLLLPSFAWAKSEESAHYYIELADKLMLTDLAEAQQSLFKATNLLKRANNANTNALLLQVFTKQAIIAQKQQNYSQSVAFLAKAKALLENNNQQSLTLNLKHLNAQVDIIHVEAQLYRLQENYQQATQLLDQALTIIEQSGDNPNLLHKTFRLRGDIQLANKKTGLALTSYLLAQHHVHSQPPEARVKLWRLIAKLYSKLDDHFSAIKYSSLELAQFIKEKNVREQMKVLLDISRSYKKVSFYKQALTYGHRALETAEQGGNEEFTLKSLLHLSIIYRRLSSYDNALKYGLEALTIYKQNNDFNGMASSFNALGLIYNQLEQKEKAKKYFNQTLHLPKEKIRPKYYAAALRELALYYYHQKDYLPALTLSGKAEAIYMKINDVKGRATILRNLGLIYQGLQDHEPAFKSFNLGLENAQKTGDAWSAAINSAYIAKLYIEHEPERAISWATKALAMAEEIDAKAIAELAYTALIAAHEQLNNYQQALVYAKKQAEVVNEIKAQDITKLAAEMHILQDIGKKNYELDVLKQQLSELTEYNQKQQDTIAIYQQQAEKSDLKIVSLQLVIGTLAVAFMLLAVVPMVKRKKRIKRIKAKKEQADG